jgi:hypothetical protein
LDEVLFTTSSFALVNNFIDEELLMPVRGADRARAGEFPFREELSVIFKVGFYL